MSVLPYALIDSGQGRKLERLGGVLVDRQASQAWWKPALAPKQWAMAQAFHHRDERGGGHWELKAPLSESWWLKHGPIQYRIQLTPFGHCGLFPEHEGAWSELAKILEARPEGSAAPRVLHLFAYTGGGTLRLAKAGAHVTHVDSAKGIVQWARENAEGNGAAELPIRWIVEDATRWVEREEKRGQQYDALVLDPPSFGRGAGGEPWKIEEHLLPLLDRCRRILVQSPLFVHLSAHTPGLTPLIKARLLEECFGDSGSVTCGELWVNEADGRRKLPAGSWARLERDSRP